ncbi:uncharacterized protein KY384_000215 [Bacidia gigantensis]|uniref:uncharacterized protein n=1 Tax=Bacidia gigantensis TaxID=2732470 RepID=UPI001D0389A8|nr:uncharacterized protein KY384_000215 [Bacidia gigantensis]KAG8526222.1 hypothetical protein KY384_000215 [Bacidia gigantensis]
MTVILQISARPSARRKDKSTNVSQGSILLCGIAIAVTIFLLLRSELKRAAVGRREFQLFLVGYLIVSLCEIFTVGGFPLNRSVRLAFTAVHIGAIVATLWVLLLNGLVGYQILDDGTPISLGLILISGIAFFVGAGYVALDTGFGYTDTFAGSRQAPNYNLALYVLYQLFPLICLFLFFVLETVLVLRVLGEKKPMSKSFKHNISSSCYVSEDNGSDPAVGFWKRVALSQDDRQTVQRPKDI